MLGKTWRYWETTVVLNSFSQGLGKIYLFVFKDKWMVARHFITVVLSTLEEFPVHKGYRWRGPQLGLSPPLHLQKPRFLPIFLQSPHTSYLKTSGQPTSHLPQATSSPKPAALMPFEHKTCQCHLYYGYMIRLQTRAYLSPPVVCLFAKSANYRD